MCASFHPLGFGEHALFLVVRMPPTGFAHSSPTNRTPGSGYVVWVVVGWRLRSCSLCAGVSWCFGTDDQHRGLLYHDKSTTMGRHHKKGNLKNKPRFEQVHNSVVSK